MSYKKVLVTGIGGNVGQGILRNIKNLPYNIHLIGTNVLDFSAGNHLCDSFYKMPYAYDKHYISSMIEVVKLEKVDLIIPATDYEVYYLSRQKNVFSSLGCSIVTSSENTCAIYLNKYKTFLHHQRYNIPFAASCLPTKYKGEYKEIIAKPQEGRGSRGLHFNPVDISTFSDEEYMIQELHRGKEITSGFYVTKTNQLHGHITFERKLHNGATNECKVVDTYDEKIQEILNKLIQHCEIRGSANLQSIVNKNGDIIPFEINCRISGTNSIRSQFGFKDVKYTLQEYLFDETPDEVNIIKGSAIRILMDVIYPENTDFSSLSNNSSKHYIF